MEPKALYLLGKLSITDPQSQLCSLLFLMAKAFLAKIGTFFIISSSDRGLGYSSMVECLPSLCKALGSILAPQKNKS
jgi:hypothetical protein